MTSTQLHALINAWFEDQTASDNLTQILNPTRAKLLTILAGLADSSGGGNLQGFKFGVEDNGMAQNFGERYINMQGNLFTVDNPSMFQVRNATGADVDLSNTGMALVIDGDFASGLTVNGVALIQKNKAQRDLIVNPLPGQAIYQTDAIPGLRVFNGTNWVRYTETVD